MTTSRRHQRCNLQRKHDVNPDNIGKEYGQRERERERDREEGEL
jgi:hypothetical protein